MASCDARAEIQSGPLYFFDQPSRRSQIKGTRSSIWRLSVPRHAAHSGDRSNRENDRELTERLTGEIHGDGTPDTARAAGAAPTIKDDSPLDAYTRAAPRLLSELAGLLSQYSECPADRSVPQGVANILNYSWEDLSAGAVRPKHPEQTRRPTESRSSAKEEDDSDGLVIKEKKNPRDGGKPERNAQVGSNARTKRRKHNSNIAHNSTAASFSIASLSCKSPGWIVGPKQPSCDEPQPISLCQWVVERLQAARNPERLQAAEPNQDKLLILRHYGSAKSKRSREKREVRPAAVGIPHIPEVQPQKLHYRINDGSSLIYYPSGRMAVCQSHSGLPCGGFYTNVFSDSQCAAVLATITAFGHGAVTDPHGSTITALWDQDGGFTCDPAGNVTKEWRWKADHALRAKIVIQMSDLISVSLFSGTSAVLSFRCDGDSVHLPLSVVSNSEQPRGMQRLQTDAKFTSDAAQSLHQNQTESPAASPESKRNPTTTPVLQMVGEVEVQEETSARWKRGGNAARQLKRLQQRVRRTLHDWLAHYREAIGIECPHTKRIPGAPLRTRLRGEVQSAALPSLNPPERTEPEHGGKERRLMTPAERPPDTMSSKKHEQEGPPVTHIGPLQIHGNVQAESVIVLQGLEPQPPAVSLCPAPPSFIPCVPLTVCPVLLRAALLGEGGRRRCCCSPTQMPALTDLEYDAFVMGQPPHSKQILVVCVTQLHQPVSTQALADWGRLEQLYRSRNKNRTMPCTQCQMDSFRLARYETSTVEHSGGVQNVLLQQRHNAAPGMVLMYMRGKLLFVGHTFSGPSVSVLDLQKQICRARGDYRLGLCLPPDYKFSDANAARTEEHNSQDAALCRKR